MSGKKEERTTATNQHLCKDRALQVMMGILGSIHTTAADPGGSRGCVYTTLEQMTAQRDRKRANWGLQAILGGQYKELNLRRKGKENRQAIKPRSKNGKSV